MTAPIELRTYATPRQLEYLDAVEKHGSNRAAAKALNVAASSIDRAMSLLRKKVASITLDARVGWAPSHDLVHPVAPGQRLRGASTLYKDGKVLIQWVKSTADDQAQQEALNAALEAMAADLPKMAPAKAPKACLEHLCNVYTLTDSHVGMLAWHREGGADWDLNIAERVLTGCFEQMVLNSPAARTCVIAQLGDYLHYDSALSAVTPQSGHSLDADGRMPKMVKVAIRILRRVIDLALKKHEKVILLLAEGNHDISSSVWLRAMFQALYEREPRIQVIDSELPYYAIQHGNTMLGWHHGHLKKNDQLPLAFATQFSEIWGSTTKRYAHTGHRHHKEVKEHSGMTVHQHSTLAARDAYAARGGWHSERNVEALTYHSRFGQVGSIIVLPEMLEAA